MTVTDVLADALALPSSPIEALLADPDVSEIMVNGPYRIFAQRHGRTERVEARFADDSHLRATIGALVGQLLDETNPVIAVRLPDGTRIDAVVPPIAVDGTMLTIRKTSRDIRTIDDLISSGTVRRAVAYLLAACVRGRLDILVSGLSGTGKSTTLNVVAQFVPPAERIATVEEIAELDLGLPHVLRLEARQPLAAGPVEVTVRDLIRTALRLRPDRLVVGEIRDGAALDLLQATATGHDGALATINASSPRDALARFATLAQLAAPDIPAQAIRAELASSFDLIVHQARLRDGTRRVTHVTEVLGMDGTEIRTQDLFVFDYAAGQDERGRLRGGLVYTGLRPRLIDSLAEAGIAVPHGLFGLQP